MELELHHVVFCVTQDKHMCAVGGGGATVATVVPASSPIFLHLCPSNPNHIIILNFAVHV
jgi:hypothetical protein